MASSDGRLSSENARSKNSTPLESGYENIGDVIIKVEPSYCDEHLLNEEDKTAKVRPMQASQLMYPSMVSTPFQKFSDEVQCKDLEKRGSIFAAHDKTGFEMFRNQILASVKLEYPNANEEDCYEIAARRWNMLSEEQRRTFSSKGHQHEKRVGNFSNGRLRGVHYDVTDGIEESEPQNKDRARDGKFGCCTWCKTFGRLNDFTSNLQGREIYCTGLCSKTCFEQAALKILNVETGYGLVSTSFQGNNPIRTNINLDRLSSEASNCREAQQANHMQPRPDTVMHHVDPARHYAEVAKPQSRLSKQYPVADRPPSNPLQRNETTSTARGAQWNIENVQRLSHGEQIRLAKTDPMYSIAENAFDWNAYIKKTNSVAAPASLFKQQKVAPPNVFQVGMKLEAKDPKQESAVCIAIVITVLGPRVRLNFDGCSKPDDVWKLCDSGDIHPVGWCEGNGGTLQKPSGFNADCGNFTEFIQRTLRNAELAPMNAFKKEPSTPKENKFLIGMKLEAVDKNNPALIGVATVTELEGDRVKVEFDGYKGAGYWTVYHDRDLFQVGWCYSNGYPLQPPGGRFSRPEPTITSADSVNTRASPNLVDKRTQHSSTHGEVDVRINGECNPGPYLSMEKVSVLPTAYKGEIGAVLKAVLEDLIRCAYDQKTVFGFLKPGRGNIVVSALSDSVVYNCYLANVDRVSTFWKVMEQFCDNLRCCSNMISGFELQTACPQCGRGPSKKVLESSVKRSYDSSIGNKEGSGKVCSSSTPDSTGMTSGDLVSGLKDVVRDSPKRRREGSVALQITTPPRSWSVEDVARFMEKTDLKDFTALFRDNDIDGKALLLLHQDIIINYMGLKIGPAVKLLDLIDEMKEHDSRFR